MSIEERLEKISMDWFLMEPALFKVLCSHKLVARDNMKCPIRCGKRRVEYNAEICSGFSDEQLEESLKAECIRILLKHPYERQPDNCEPVAITMGSNCVLGENYNFRSIKMENPRELGLEPNQYFELYAKEINRLLSFFSSVDEDSKEDSTAYGDSTDDEDSLGNGLSGKGRSGGSDDFAENGCSSNNGDSGGDDGSGGKESSGGVGGSEKADSKDIEDSSREQALADASGLWEEDAMASAEINEMIHQMEASNQWGSIPGRLVGRIVASTIVKIDYRRVMQSFRAEVLSSKRRLTRMRPNRRSGFQNFGSVYRLSSRLLVAIDVSGSTTDDMVSKFFGIVNKFFKYGIEEIDVIQFDTEIKGEPVNMKKAKIGVINITGRGGTSFQPVFDYAAEQKNYYQGLVIFTDGYASKPKPSDFFRTPVLWVLPYEELYKKHKEWMEQTGKACFIMW